MKTKFSSITKKNKDWGYLCNHGPAEKGEKGLYVASKDNSTGKYNVYQRLDLTDPLATTLEEGLEDAEIEGGISEITTTDRVNQIMTTITELFKEMQILFNEYVYWKTK